MRVRKRTSKRTSTRMREGIKKKAAAQHRKERKLAKKDPTWKSKQKKDPGIPSNFPYKNRIIEAIDERKRQEIEERKLKKNQTLEAQKSYTDQLDDVMECDNDLHDSGNGLSALLESAQQAANDYDGVNDERSKFEDIEVIDHAIDFYEDPQDHGFELEKSRKAYDKIFKTVVDMSDVILYVLDARDPESTRSRKVEQAILQSQGKRLILILNKVDLVPPNVLEQWLNTLKSSFPTIPLKAAPGATDGSAFNKRLTQTVTANGLLESLKKYSNNSNLKRSIVVGVIGYPNVGKSSVINSLTLRRGGFFKPCPVGNQAGITTSLREVKIDNRLKIIDSPGICFPNGSQSKSRTEQNAELALLNVLPPKYITDPYPAILMLIKRLSKSDEMTNSFKKCYDLPPIPANDADSFTKQFLIHVARKRGRLGKGGIPNLSSAGISVLNDWRDGKFLGWTLPRTSQPGIINVDSIQSDKVDTGISCNPSKVEQISIVQQWSKEFDLDGLFASLDDAAITEHSKK